MLGLFVKRPFVQAGTDRRLGRRQVLFITALRGALSDLESDASVRRGVLRETHEHGCEQDDAFTESYITTIGVDFVSGCWPFQDQMRHKY